MFGSKNGSKATTSIAWGKLTLGKDKGKKSKQGLNPFQGFENKGVDEELSKGVQGVTLTVSKRQPTQQDPPATDQSSNDGWTHIVSRPRTANKLPAPSISSAQPNTTAATEAPWLTTDWRAPRDPEAELAHQAAATSIYKKPGDRKKYRPGPRTKAGVYFCDQRPGTIIFRPDARPCLNPNIPDSNPSITYKDGVRYRTKRRYWLIVKATRKRVWECPIYTNDTGLMYIDPKFWREYFSLLPEGLSLEGLKHQSPGNNVFSIAWMDENDAQMPKRKMRSTMVVHFTEVMMRCMTDDEVRMVGALKLEEIEEACGKAAAYTA